VTDPFRLPGPCIVGCSGGRTSGYQLRKVLDAHGGTLPPTIRVVYANTGKERKETLNFIERISQEWGVEIAWLEYRNKYPDHGFAVVNYATASRNSEPFDQMLAWKAQYRKDKGLPPVLPNPVQRMCTGELKERTIRRAAMEWWKLAHKRDYYVALALRADEQNRIESARKRDVDAGTPIFPLDDANVTADDVLAFWKAQPFDLTIKSYQGNCDLCYMKSRGRLDRLIREEPERAAWWIEKERQTGQTFRQDRPGYAGLHWQATHQPLLPFAEPPPEIESIISCEGGYCSD
jgi:3'-phosphoadenosine 5'-phosphosulfate sulfotransferase (PAPS reductase)/FAD synthetase